MSYLPQKALSTARSRPLSLIEPLLIAVVGVGLLALIHAYSTDIAGGSDAYGYVSEAVRLANGQFYEPERVFAPFGLLENSSLTSTLGYRPLGPDGLVPTYPFGYPLLMAIAIRLAGMAGAFWAAPILATGAVILTYLAGRHLLGRSGGIIAASLVAILPNFMWGAFQPMSDVPATFFAVLALVGGIRRRSRVIAPLLMIVCGIILSFGPLFHLSRDTAIQLPVPMPYTILFHRLPGFTALRVPARFAALVVLGLTILAGDGVARLLARLRHRRRVFGQIPAAVTLGMVCLVLAIAEGAPDLPIQPVRTGRDVPPVYQWLAQQPRPSPVVELPIDDNAFHESPRSYYSTYDHQPLVDGFRSFVPPAYDSLVSDISSFPSTRSVSTLAWLGVRYVVVHQAELTSEQRTKIGAVPIDLPVAARFGDDVVYQVLPATTTEELTLSVLQAGSVSQAGGETTLHATLRRSDNGHTIVLAENTQNLTFQLNWESLNKATYVEIINAPTSAPALVSPQSIDLPAHLPGQAGRYALTVTLIDQPNVNARFTIPSVDVAPKGLSSTTTGSAAGASTVLDSGSTVPSLLESILPSTRLSDATGGIPYLLNWQVSRKPDRPLVVFVNAYDEQNRYWSFPRGTETRFSAAETKPGQIIAEADSLPLKPNIPPGHYWVEVGLLDPTTNQRVPFVGPTGVRVTRVVVGSFWLLPPDVIPSGGNPSAAADARVFGGQIALDTAQAVGPLAPGGKLRVDLRWRAKEAPKANYTAFVHVVDSSGKLIAQDDAQPTGGVYPTSAWLTGDTIVDTMIVQLPANLPPGPYQIQVGLYDLKTLRRLPVTLANGAAQGDFVAVPVP